MVSPLTRIVRRAASGLRSNARHFHGGRRRCGAFGRAEPLERRVLLATVSGIKFNDLDGDGVGEVGEPGLPGWTIYHDANNNGALDGRESSDVTGANGAYSLTFIAGTLTPTTEVIREVPMAGWRPTTPGDDGAITLVMTNTQSRTVNFGNTQRGLVTGTKFNDQDGDGRQDLNDLPLANFTVFADLDNDGALDAAEPRDVTDAAGNYALNLPTSAARYTIREVDQAGWRQTLPGPAHAPAPYSVLLDEPGETAVARNFGNTRRVLLTGLKVHDLDADGVRDAAEPGLAGWRIYVDANDNGNFDAGEFGDVTDADGRYSIAPTGGGPFLLREAGQAGFRQTAPQGAANGDAHRVVFVAPFEGRTASGLNFLNTRRPLVSGTKFNDADSDGVRDAGEAGLGGFTLYHDEDNDGTFDAGEASTVTADDGTYSLSLPPGTDDLARLYRIREVDQAFWRQTFPTVNGGANLVALLPGETIANRNFGNTQRALISGVKYEDRNGNGTRDEGEPGVAGVRVYGDSNDNGMFDAGEESALTAADGSYSFDVAAPLVPIPGRSNFVLREVLLAGWIPINPPGGELPMTLLRGATVTGRDFGNARTSALGGRKYHDLDADGVDDAAEPGLADWRIYVDTNNNGVYDTDTDAVAATTGLPDTTSTTSVTRSRIAVSGLSPVLTDLNVRVDLTHPNVSDLTVRLISPRGTRIELFSNVGGTSDNIDRVLLDDESANTFAATFPPYANETLRPEGSLSAFDNQNPNGQWTLEVTDAGSASVGSLDAWELILTTAEPSDLTAAPNGVYAIFGLPPGPHVVREVRQAGWFPTGPVSATRNVTTASGLIIANVDFGNALPGSISGRKFEDRDADGVIDAGELGLAGWVIYRDLDNDGVMDSFNRRFDQPSAGTLRDAIDVPGPGPGVIPGITQFVMPVSAPNGLIIDLNVAVNITHPRIADLTLVLTSPSGRAVSLTGDITAAGANMNTTFDDSAPTAIGSGTPPYTGVFRPAEPLGEFESDDPDGAWRLTIFDTALGPAGAATLNSWSLDLTFGDPRRLTDVSGAYSFVDLRPGVVHVVREIDQPGWQQTFPTGDGAHRVNLDSDQDVTGRNFGNRAGVTITGAFVRGSQWLLAANADFLAEIESNGLGDADYGLLLPASPGAGDTLPWINMNQVVLRYDTDLPAAPLPGPFTLDGDRSDYTATPSMIDSRTVLLTLDRALGNQPGGGNDGDRVALRLPAEMPGSSFQRTLLVLQGDANRAAGRVNAIDLAFVKARANRTAAETPPAGLAPYSLFADVDANGRINAIDLAAVKARANDSLPPVPLAATAPAFLSGPAAPLFGTRRVRTAEAGLDDLLD